MLKHLIKNKWQAGAICGFAVLVGLGGYWVTRSAADPREDLLQGDYAAAIAKYERAAEEGDAGAQNTLGNIYYLGLGVTRDYEEAARWYLRAAKTGNGPSLVNLGILHRHGLGVEKDILKAFACFLLAERAGIKKAKTHMKFLTRMNYITGHMVEAARENYRELPNLIKNIKIGRAPQQPQ
ncbi:MAG: tetratricopeptide repeat protein [Filomicrobium sp.]